GGTGLLGRLLTHELKCRGHQVCVLSRNPARVKGVKAFYWNVEKREIDSKCIHGVDVIIHLAGEGVADKRWTRKRKRILISSRVNSINLLYKVIAEEGAEVECVISASAVGIYGDRGEEILVEESSAGNSFLAECCDLWEDAVNKGRGLGLRIVKFRIGLLLTQNGG